MYTTIPVGTWDVVRQILFLAAVVGICAIGVNKARVTRSWKITGLSALLASGGCAMTVLAIYALSTALGAEQIRQVPEFIRDYTYHGFTSPATYFADHYWALLELQAFTWVIGVAGMATLGTLLGRAAASVFPLRAA